MDDEEMILIDDTVNERAFIPANPDVDATEESVDAIMDILDEEDGDE